jgi:pimeloyl-ACP methyl ester carboxylesterase
MSEPSQAGRIEASQFVGVNGLEQWVTVRGNRADNPILLIIPGPGAGVSVLAPYFAAWEDSFTIVQWDQPLAGATYARHGRDIGEYSFDRLARDGLAVVEYLHASLRARQLSARVVPLAWSGGSILALHMLKRRPDLFAAYVGTGQFVNWPRQDALSYQLVLEQARTSGNAQALADLERIGPPPYSDTATDAAKSAYCGALSAGEQEAFAALPPEIVAAMFNPPVDSTYLPSGLTMEKDVRSLGMAAYDRLRSEIVGFDAERLGVDFGLPMLFLQGEDDVFSVSSEVRSYVDRIHAPYKAYISVERGGHSSWLMRARFLQMLVAHLVPVLERR